MLLGIKLDTNNISSDTEKVLSNLYKSGNLEHFLEMIIEQRVRSLKDKPTETTINTPDLERKVAECLNKLDTLTTLISNGRFNQPIEIRTELEPEPAPLVVEEEKPVGETKITSSKFASKMNKFKKLKGGG